VGKLGFAARVIRHGRAFLGRLIEAAKKLRHLHFRTRLTSEARADLDWWAQCLEIHNGIFMYRDVWDPDDITHVYSDASDWGFGAACGPEWFALKYAGEYASLSQRSINFRELHVAVKALATWGPCWEGKKVLFHIDNAAACGILNKLYSPVRELMELVRSWCLMLEQYQVSCRVVYIATHLNSKADALSRGRIEEFRELSPESGPCTWPSHVKFYQALI
jgi:hypothetical protein